MKYTVVSASELDIVIKIVNINLNEGWICQGGILVTPSITGGYLLYYQAMTK